MYNHSVRTGWIVLTCMRCVTGACGQDAYNQRQNKRCEFRIKSYLICIIRALNRCTTHITVAADSLSRPFNRIYCGVCTLIDTDSLQLNFRCQVINFLRHFLLIKIQFGKIINTIWWENAQWTRERIIILMTNGPVNMIVEFLMEFETILRFDRWPDLLFENYNNKKKQCLRLICDGLYKLSSCVRLYVCVKSVLG